MLYRTQVRLNHCRKTENHEQEAHKCSISQPFLLISTKAFEKYGAINHFLSLKKPTLCQED